MAIDMRIEDHIGLVHLQAKKGFKWADGAKSGLTYEDIFQEASIAFVIAANGFDPEVGVKFSAYYSQIAFSVFRKAIGTMTGVKNLNEIQRQEIEDRKTENDRRASLALAPLHSHDYGIQIINFSEFGMTDEDSDPFELNLPSDIETPEEIVAFREIVKSAIDNLSPMAQVLVEWLQNPPDELLRELEQQSAHADEMEARGNGKAAWRFREGLSISNVGKFLQKIGEVPRGQLVLAERELLNAINEIEEASKYGN